MGHTLVVVDGSPVPGRARGHRARPRGGRAAEGREPRARGPGHQARRHDGLRGVPRGLRGAGREGAHQPPHARRLRRRDDVAHQPRRAGHGRVGAAAHGRPGQHHRRRRHRLSGGVLGRVRGAAPRFRRQQGHDRHEHLRPPRHPGRGVGGVPRHGGSPAPGRPGLLRADRGEPRARARPGTSSPGRRPPRSPARRPPARSRPRCSTTWPPRWRW